MEEHDVLNVGVDVRRFTSFGVVKVRFQRISLYEISLWIF